MDLTTALNKTDAQTQGVFDRLNYNSKVVIRDAWRRHVQACERQDIQPDPQVVKEVVSEARNER